jgi:hypothetical protein
VTVKSVAAAIPRALITLTQFTKEGKRTAVPCAAGGFYIQNLWRPKRYPRSWCAFLFVEHGVWNAMLRRLLSVVIDTGHWSPR